MYPANKLHNEYEIITSKRHFDVIMTYLLHTIFAEQVGVAWQILIVNFTMTSDEFHGVSNHWKLVQQHVLANHKEYIKYQYYWPCVWESIGDQGILFTRGTAKERVITWTNVDLPSIKSCDSLDLAWESIIKETLFQYRWDKCQPIILLIIVISTNLLK